MNGGVLLYPNINLANPELIKEALLFYGRLYRIVPKGIIPKDCEEIDVFNREYGLIKNITPDQYAKQASNEFKKKIRPWSQSAVGFNVDLENHAHLRIHEDKVYVTLKNWMLENGLLYQKGKWLTGSDSLLSNYMLYLSIEISKKNQLSLMTNNQPAWISNEFMNYDGNFISHIGGPTHMQTSMCLKDYIPSNLSSITFDSIVKFREKHGQECQNFLNEYNKFQQEISSLTSTDVINDKIQDYKKHLDKSIEDYKKACSLLKTKTFMGLKIVTIPVFLDVANGLINLEPRILTTLKATGLFFGALWSLQSWRHDVKEIRKSNPYSYLVYLQDYEFDDVEAQNSDLFEDMKEYLED